MDVDEVYSHIGEFGPMQKKYVFGICLASFYTAFINLNLEFTAFAPDFSCYKIDEPTSPLLNKCPNNEAAACAAIKYHSNYTTLVTEWDLVCDQTYRAKASQSTYMAGLMLAAPLVGPLADKIGRQRTMFISLLALIGCLGGSMAAPTYDVFVILRFVSGCVSIGIILPSFVLVSEIVGGAQRAFVGNLVSAVFAVGIPALAVAAAVVHSWRHLYLLMMVLGCGYFTLYFYLPESPRWLLLSGRPELALRVLQRIARGNGASLPPGVTLRSGAARSAAPAAEGITTLFKYRKVAGWTLVMMFSWFVNNLCYYGLTAAAATMGSDRFSSVALSGLIELPAYVIVALVLNRFGRRLPLCGFMLLGGGCCLSIVGLPRRDDMAHLRMLLGLVGKLCASASFSVIFIHSGEIFPTSIRNTGYGLVNVFARLGGICYPFMALLNDVYPDLHFVVFGALAAGSGLLNLSLPETLGRPLPTTVEELAGAQHSTELYSPLTQLGDADGDGDGDGDDSPPLGRKRVVRAV